MKNKIFVFVLLLTLLLTACAQSSPSETASPDSPTPLNTATKPEATKEASCIVQGAQPTPNPTLEAILPPVGEGDHVRGVQDATATLIVYNDFQCENCALFAPVLAQLQDNYEDDLRVSYRPFPSPENDKAFLAAQAAEAAGLQDKFWEMHDVLFIEHSEWVSISKDAFQDWLIEQADALSLDVDQFEEDLNSETLGKWSAIWWPNRLWELIRGP